MSTQGKNLSVPDLEHLALLIRRNVMDICMQRGGYAGQGIALAESARRCLSGRRAHPRPGAEGLGEAISTHRRVTEFTAIPVLVGPGIEASLPIR